jgi:hypothetical protein
MGDEHPSDARDLLAALEEKLRRLGSELRGTAGEVQDVVTGESPAAAPDPMPPPSAAPPPSPAEQPEPAPRTAAGPPADDGLLAAARRECDELRVTVDGLAGAADELRVLARTVAADHAGALLRLQRAAAAARRAVDAADRPPAGLVPDAVLVEAAPLADPAALEALRAAVAALPGTRDVQVRRFGAGQAVLQVRLGAPEGV